MPQLFTTIFRKFNYAFELDFISLFYYFVQFDYVNLLDDILTCRTMTTGDHSSDLVFE